MLTTHEAASYLRLSPRTLERLRVSGTGPKFVRLGRRSIRYPQQYLEAYLASRVVSSTSQKGNGNA
jgi:excisionase family DNA binding protein